MDFVFVGILILMLLDSRLLKSKSGKAFAQEFKVGKGSLSVMILLSAAFLSLSLIDLSALAILNCLLILPIYLLRRQRVHQQISHLHLDDSKYTQTYHAYEVVMVWIYFLVASSSVVQLIKGEDYLLGSALGELMIVNIASSVFLLFLIVRAVKYCSQDGVLNSLALTRGGQPLWKVLLIPMLFGLSCAFFSATSVVARSVHPNTPLSEMLEGYYPSSVLFGFIALAVLFAPLFEEVVFRGYLFRVLRDTKGQLFAFIFVSLSFGILHVHQYWGDWLAIAVVMFLGFLLTFVRIWTKSTTASAVLHYFYNGGVVIFTMVLMTGQNPAYFEYHIKEGKINFQEKERLLRSNIEHSPYFPDAYHDLATLYLNEGVHFNEALQMVDRALEINSGSTGYLDTKADVLCKLGMVRQAKAIRQRLIHQSDSKKFKAIQRKKLKEMEQEEYRCEQTNDQLG